MSASVAFLNDLIRGNKSVNVGTKLGLGAWFLALTALLTIDVGAGIGRVTQHLLSKFFDQVDLLEFNQDFLEVAKTRVLKEVGCRILTVCLNV